MTDMECLGLGLVRVQTPRHRIRVLPFHGGSRLRVLGGRRTETWTMKRGWFGPFLSNPIWQQSYTWIFKRHKFLPEAFFSEKTP